MPIPIQEVLPNVVRFTFAVLILNLKKPLGLIRGGGRDFYIKIKFLISSLLSGSIPIVCNYFFRMTNGMETRAYIQVLGEIRPLDLESRYRSDYLPY
jgi:hypothetical protein